MRLPDATHPTSVYVIAAVADPQTVAIGRHFRAVVVEQAADLATLTAPRRGGVVIPPVNHDLNPVGRYVTHLLTATPTEFLCCGR